MQTRKLFVFLLLLFSTFGVASQAAAACPAAQNSNLVTWTTDLVDCLPDEGSNGFAEPDATEIANFKAAVAALLAEKWSEADTLADAVNYEVFAYTDAGNGNETLYALHPEAGNSDGRGYFFVRPQSQVKRNLLIEAPHPINDQDSAVVASRIFRETGARAFSFAGTHRCASSSFTTCAGTTEVCNDSDIDEAHRISDMAHHQTSFFQAFHEVASQEPDTVTLQIHGFGSGLPTREFSVSDGSEITRPATYVTNALAAALESRMLATVSPLPRPGNSCNRAGDEDELCATENVQARFTNGSTNLCAVNEVTALDTTGRFIHLELSSDLRDTEDAGEPDRYSPQVVIDAVNTAFPERKASVGNRVWADLNSNGVQDPGEPGLADVLLIVSGSEGNRTARSAADGSYKIGNLLGTGGTYHGQIVPPNGYDITLSQAGNDPSADSDFDHDGLILNFPLAANERRIDMDGGLVPQATNGQISGRVWSDTDGDGRIDAGEPSVSDVTVTLLGPNNRPIASTTPVAGLYQFTGLFPTTYRVKVDAGNRGFAEAVSGVDNDVNPMNWMTTFYTLSPGAMTVTNVDAGVISRCFQQMFIPMGAAGWKTLTPAAAGITNWFMPNFNDSGWAANRTAPLGYGTTVTTTVDAPVFPSHTVYFRRTFTVADRSFFQYLTVRVKRDDGVVVYINGTEVLRDNVPHNPIDAGTPALQSSNNLPGEVILRIPPGVLLNGTNTVAVELHDRFKDSDPDGRFDLELTGTACDNCRISTTDITAGFHTYLSEATTEANSNFGLEDEIEFDGTGSRARGLLKWNVDNPAFDNLQLLAVEIEVDVTNPSNQAHPLYRVKRDWSETEATWNRPKVNQSWVGAGSTATDYDNTALLGTLPSNNLEGTFTVGLTAAGVQVVQGWLNGSISNFGLVSVSSLGAGLDISSDESPKPPKLRLVYPTATCTP